MTNQARDLIQRLANDLEYGPRSMSSFRLLAEARAYLAQPEPEGPTDEELQSMLYYEFSTSTGHGTREDPIGFARAVLARYGNFPPTPIPLSERHPTGVDCDDEGRCWLCGKIERDWRLISIIRPGVTKLSYVWSHWLPHWALPVPGQEADR